MSVIRDSAETKKAATREGYGQALAELGRIHEDLIVMDADLAGSTKTSTFRKEFPERHINCGIAEANMMGIAAGLASCGKTVFASSFAMFATGRAFEQIRNSIAHTKLNVKVAASHAGISVGEDGATHQCCEDISLMRSIPGMVVINPCDDTETKAAVKAAYEYDGPVYLRLGRLAVPVLLDPKEYRFEIGKGVLLKEGTDVTIFATGLEVYESLRAAQMLEAEGIRAEVINIHTIKPIDEELILKSLSKTGKGVTVEEHSVIGGLYSAVSEVTAAKLPVHLLGIGVEDVFGHSGPAKDLLKEFGLDAQGICRKVRDFLQK